MKLCAGCSHVFVRDLRSGSIELVSVSSSGVPADAVAYSPDITPDGRFIVFASEATNLTPAGGNECPWYEGPVPCAQIFVRDRKAQTTSVVSVSSSGVLADGQNYDPHISDDGRRIVFTSEAGNLVTGDTYSCRGYQGDLDHYGARGGCPDVYVHDRESRGTTRASVSSTGQQPNAPAWEPDISGNGIVVVFSSMADNLVSGDDETSQTGGSEAGSDIFVRDLEAHTTTSPTIASRTAAPSPGSSLIGGTDDDLEEWHDPSASRSGTSIVYERRPRRLAHVFLYDASDGSRVLVTRSTGGGFDASIDAGGQAVLFRSTTSDREESCFDDECARAFLWTRETGATIGVSILPAGGPSRYDVPEAALSADGSFAAFSVVDRAPCSGCGVVYVRDRARARSVRVS